MNAIVQSHLPKLNAAVSAADTVRRQEPLAASLFDALREGTSRGNGICRDAYGEGENFAHRLLAKAGRDFGFEIDHDAAANSYVTMAGRDRSQPRVIIGSHLDSVADGGNFDGAAGVVAGLIAIKALKETGFRPRCDITVMGIRAEESVWFTTTFFGSSAALGRVAPDVCEKRTRLDTGKTLAEHLRACGGDPDRLRSGQPYLKPSNVAAFLEVHIEQGPVLEAEKLPVGIVTGIRGNYRLPAARVIGEYSHCGVPRAYRRDSAVAAADFIAALDALWREWDAAGKDMAFTVGKLFTDPQQHALTKIPGEVSFSLDLRSVDPELLAELEQRLQAIANDVARRRGVQFDLGIPTRAAVGMVSPSIRASFQAGAAELGMPVRVMASGASHDAAAFAQAGIPMGMLFVRNANGSHNPFEHMEITDLLQATRLLTWWLVEHCDE
jgi:beta-ureidopropionase / N-carbamoyl-L-amino-acid hydrolase